MPTVLLRPGKADRILAGHPWIFQNAILRLTQEVQDGDLVQVKDHRQRMVGTGLYNSQSKIQVRLIANDKVAITQSFFEERFRAALALRQRHMPEATSFRVVNAESDFLSGLIVDKYEDVLVLQISSLGMDHRKQLIVEALNAVFSPRAILERSDAPYRKSEGLDSTGGLLKGNLDDPNIKITLNGLSFNVNLDEGHKTGLYLDQQENYQTAGNLVAQYKDARVLDCFSYLGGFALHAARAGANQVIGLDQSAAAVAAATKNAKENNVDGICSFEETNVFDWLKAKTAVKKNETLIPEFDVIILDPPSFTRNRASLGNAARGYKEIHLRALKLLKPGGTLATYCCSHHVDANMFEDVILDAAFDAHKVLRRVATYGQSADHPVLPIIPETEYLKGFAYEIAR